MTATVSAASRKFLGSIILPSASVALTFDNNNNNNHHHHHTITRSSIIASNTIYNKVKHVSFCEAVRDDTKEGQDQGHGIQNKKEVVLRKRVSVSS